MGKSAGAPMMRSVTPSGQAISADELEALPKPPPQAAGTVKVGKVEVQGGVTEKSVKQPIEKQLAELVSAYSSELSSQPGLRGKMVVEFTVGANGLVRDVKVALNELTPDLEQAVIQFLKKLKIANSTGSGATVKVTFNFTP
jgi:TonB family protein